MLISFRDNTKFNNVCLYFLVITTLIGPMVYLGFASLYHFYVAGLLLLVLCKGMHTGILKTDIMTFLALWFLEAIISTLWAPDKLLALRYVYYIFLITGICVLFHYFLTKENLIQFAHFMVVVLFVCNLIALWEMLTGNHLPKNYLSNPLAANLLKYVPGGFYVDPNDFATYIVQIIPFSFACVFSSKKHMRMISASNLILSFITVCATNSRAQILLLPIMYFLFFVVCRKKEIIKIAGFVGGLAVALYFLYPEMNDLIDGALQSVSGKALISEVALNGRSLNIRINLLKNAGHILLDTFGFGIGPGCHRTVMGEYSSLYFNTGRVRDMHNLLGELFADYGILIAVLFLRTIVRSCRSLYRIYKNSEDGNVQMLAIMLAFSLGVFILCGTSSSSIIQHSSVWMTFGFTSAFIRLYKKNPA